MSLEHTKPELAYEIAGNRLADDKLQVKVDNYLADIIPENLVNVDNPKAVFAPYLAKGSIVEIEFLDIASENRFSPVIATYLGSEYVTANPVIVDCYKAPLMLPKGQNSRQWVVPETERSGEVGTAKTIYPGLDIAEFWEGIRNAVIAKKMPTANSELVDFGDWYKVQAARFGWSGERSKASYYYMALMGLYASGRAVLFDLPPSDFDDRIMAPAASFAMEKLGEYPLITSVLRPQKRDWTDLSFLEADRLKIFQETGRIPDRFDRIEARDE